MQNNQPILADLVLVGGGHAQIAVLKAFAMTPLPGVRLTLVTNASRTPYSGMLPGYVEGVWDDDELHIDLRHLAQFAGARIIIASVTGIDADTKTIFFDDRPALNFDILSINIGGHPNTALIPGADQNSVPVKPIAAFQEKFLALFAADLPKKLAIIGGGAAGCELALSLATRWKNETGHLPELAIISRSSRLMPHMAPRAGRLVENRLHDIGAKVIRGHYVINIDKQHVTLDNADKVDFDACFLVTAVTAPLWLASTGLALDQHGFITVGPSLQSVSHPYIFAAGDCASVRHGPRPKAGVFAVRAGRILAANLRRFIIGKALRHWRPQKHYLALIGTADGSAIAARGNLAVSGRAWWHMKCWIDQRFMTKYKNLKMPLPAAITGFAGVPRHAAPDTLHTSDTANMATDNILVHDPAFSAMRCLGCAAKTSHQVLQTAMHDAVTIALANGANPELMPPSGLETDSALLPEIPASTRLVQSVDVLSEIVTDPFILGQIASVHAFSDIYASLSNPLYSLAIINLPESEISIQTNQLTHLLAGALLAHSAAGVKLVGGHTSEGGGLSIGFAVTGSTPHAHIHLQPDKMDRLVLVLTKPIGSGVIMAANMQLCANAAWVDAAIAEMTRSNAAAAHFFKQHSAHAATDVTGFGLARHALNLALRLGYKGCHIDVSCLPILDGARDLLSAGIRSSLHAQNRLAVKLHAGHMPPDILAQILFDPQTSGGLLGVFSENYAHKVVSSLSETGHKAAIIGSFAQNYDGLHITQTFAGRGQ